MFSIKMRNTPVETDRIITGFLTNQSEAVALVTGWARGVARSRAWGFETSEDIVQQTLLVVVQNLRAGKFQGGNLPAYVRRIAKNICISNYRRARTRGAQVPLGESLRTTEADGAGIERRAMLARILAILDAPCRQLIEQAYFYGLSRKEIAARWGISAGAAKVRLFRCLEKARVLQDQVRDPAAPCGEER